jgi:hypothetical protein
MERLRDYANEVGPKGEASSKANLNYWSDRAKANSKITPRSEDSEMKLPSTKTNVRDSAMGPKVSRNVDARMAGKDDLNHAGGSFMKNVRRTV